MTRSARSHRASRRIGLLVAAVALIACNERPAGPTCSDGTARDPDRVERLRERLGSHDTARALVLATQGRYVVCFGEGIEPGVDAQHRIRLDATSDDARAAAKLGHLLMHVSHGLPFVEDDPRPCAERLARAEERERAGHALESSLLRRFGLPPLGEAALDRVMAGYRSRCKTN